MLLVAISLDMLGIITGILILLFGIGAVLSYIPDFLGLFTIGAWVWLRTGKMPLTKRLRRFLRRTAVATVGEMIPLVGILPLWTIYVFLELRKK